MSVSGVNITFNTVLKPMKFINIDASVLGSLVGKPVKKNPIPAAKGEMSCEDCGGRLTVLATTAVCDFCHPPKGYRAGTDGKLYKLPNFVLQDDPEVKR